MTVYCAAQREGETGLQYLARVARSLDRPPAKTKIQRREMARLYRAGYDARRISVALGCSLRCVYRQLTKALCGT